MLKKQIQGFISSWFDYFMSHCPMRSVIKLSHLQVMNTSTRLPTGKKKKNITPIPALLHRLPEIDLFITKKAVHSFPQTHSTFWSMYSWTSLFSLPPKYKSKRERALMWESLKPIYYLLYHFKPVFLSLTFAFFNISFLLCFAVLSITFCRSCSMFLLTHVDEIAIAISYSNR